MHPLCTLPAIQDGRLPADGAAQMGRQVRAKQAVGPLSPNHKTLKKLGRLLPADGAAQMGLQVRANQAVGPLSPNHKMIKPWKT
jgi:hypothetical protein